MKRLLYLLLLLGFLSAPAQAAQCTGVDDTILVQGLIDAGAGGKVALPSGNCMIHEPLHIPGDTIVSGRQSSSEPNTTLIQAPGAGPSERLIYTDGDNITIEHMELDGNRANQTINEQRHAIFNRNANVIIRHVEAHHLTGDGFYLYRGSTNVKISYVRAHDNGRDGIAITGAIGASISHSQFYDNDFDQVDVEPGKGEKVGNIVFDAITVGGAGQKPSGLAVLLGGRPLNEPGLQADGLVLRNSFIYGPVRVGYTDNAIVRNNAIANLSNKPALQVYGYNSNTQVTNNSITQLPNTVAYAIAVDVVGTSSTDNSSGTVIENNRITQVNAGGLGIRAQGLKDIKITNNTLQGAGIPSAGRGIQVRATAQDLPFNLATVIGNKISDFGSIGLGVYGNFSAVLSSLVLQNNTFFNTATPAPQTIGASLDDGTKALRSATCGGNVAGQGVTQSITKIPAGVTCTF